MKTNAEFQWLCHDAYVLCLRQPNQDSQCQLGIRPSPWRAVGYFSDRGDLAGTSQAYSDLTGLVDRRGIKNTIASQIGSQCRR